MMALTFMGANNFEVWWGYRAMWRDKTEKKHSMSVSWRRLQSIRQVSERPQQGIMWQFVPENSQRNVLFPWTVFPHSNPKSGAEEKLSRRHQVALLRCLELQHSTVPDEGMKLTVGGRRGIKMGRPCLQYYISEVQALVSGLCFLRFLTV